MGNVVGTAAVGEMAMGSRDCPGCPCLTLLVLYMTSWMLIYVELRDTYVPI